MTSTADEEAVEEIAKQKELEEKYKTLTEWLTEQVKDVVKDGSCF